MNLLALALVLVTSLSPVSTLVQSKKPQPTPSSVMGFVYKADMSPVSDATTQLRVASSHKVEQVVRTDVTGQFYFIRVPAGTYVVEVLERVGTDGLKVIGTSAQFTLKTGDSVFNPGKSRRERESRSDQPLVAVVIGHVVRWEQDDVVPRGVEMAIGAIDHRRLREDHSALRPEVAQDKLMMLGAVDTSGGALRRGGRAQERGERSQREDSHAGM